MKAIIMSHEKGGSYVMDKEGAFRHVLGHTHKPIGAEIELKAIVSFNYRKFSAMAASIALVIVVGSFSWLWTSESHTIYVEINPGVQLIFNRLDRLIRTTPLDANAAEILGEINLRGTPTDVVTVFIESAQEKGFSLHNGRPAVILMTFTNRAGNPSDDTQTAVAQALQGSNIQDLTVIKVDGSDYFHLASEAIERGVSLGRLGLALAVQAGSDGDSLDDLLNMDVRDLMDENN